MSFARRWFIVNGEGSGSDEETGYDWWQSGDVLGVVRFEGTISLLIVRCGDGDDSGKVRFKGG